MNMIFDKRVQAAVMILIWIVGNLAILHLERGL